MAEDCQRRYSRATNASTQRQTTRDRLLGRERGKEALSVEVEKPVLGYAGDTTVGRPEAWFGCQVLIHEATFLNHEDAGDQTERRNRHSVLTDVLAMAKEAKPGALILNHFSSRYEKNEILEAIGKATRKIGLSLPIHIIPPGEVVRDVLGTDCVIASGN